MKIKYSSIIFFITQTMFINIGLNQILNSSFSIMSVFIGSIISLFLSLFVIRIMYYKNKLNIFKKNEFIYGKFSKIINLLLVLIISFYFIYMLFSINTYVQNKYLDSTPSYIIILLFLIPVIWASSISIKSISKISLILFFITSFIIIFSIINLTPYIEFNNFKPLNTNILKGSFLYVIYFTTPSILLLINQDINESKKTIVLFFIISIINMLLLLIYIVGIFGIDLGKTFTYPEYSLMKKINYFDFIQHIENIFTFEWLYSFFITSTLSLKFIKDYINKKIIFYIFIVISFLLSLVLFNNIVIANNFIKIIYPIIFIILLLYIFSFNILIKRNKN